MSYWFGQRLGRWLRFSFEVGDIGSVKGLFSGGVGGGRGWMGGAREGGEGKGKKLDSPQTHELASERENRTN